MKGIESNNCELKVVDYLDYDQYIDIEELRAADIPYEVHQVIDIERPSMASIQHYYIFYAHVNNTHYIQDSQLDELD